MAPLPFMEHIRTNEYTVHYPELRRPEVMNYAMMWMNCCQSIKWNQRENMGEVLDMCAAKLRERTYEEVRASAMAGNAENILEVGFRYRILPGRVYGAVS